ncbi:MAG: mismatch-specific DNA-glycosylase [Acidimicrobiia bacterium]
MGFTRAELEAFRDATVDDLIGPDPRLVFVGINPGLWTAATGTHFAHPGNRFYPALLRAGIIEREIDRSVGFTADDRRHLIDRQVAITNLVMRATARASELGREELETGGTVVRAKIERWRPRVVAFAGITAFRQAYARPRAGAGRQEQTWEGCAVWVVPNPSGLNAHETIDTLARAYREVGVAAGVVDD